MSQHLEKFTSVLLNGKNYLLWARHVTFGLNGREKLEHMNGGKPQPKPKTPEAPTPEEKKAIAEWRRDDHLVISWLLATMKPHISDLLIY